MLKTIKTAGGAGSTTLDSAIVPIFGITGAEQQKLRVEVNSTASRADFFIGNVLASPAGGLGNLPLTTTATVRILHAGITKIEDAGITARYSKMDYLRLQSYPTTPR